MSESCTSDLHITARNDVVEFDRDQFRDFPKVFRIDPVFNVQVVLDPIATGVLVDRCPPDHGCVTDTSLACPFEG